MLTFKDRKLEFRLRGWNITRQKVEIDWIQLEVERFSGTLIIFENTIDH